MEAEAAETVAEGRDAVDAANPDAVACGRPAHRTAAFAADGPESERVGAAGVCRVRVGALRADLGAAAVLLLCNRQRLVPVAYNGYTFKMPPREERIERTEYAVLSSDWARSSFSLRASRR